MSDYPGQDPQGAGTPDEAPAGTPGAPDSGPGYWERKAAEEQAQQAQEQTSPYGQQGPTFNPTTGYGAPPPPPPAPAGSQPAYYGYPQQAPPPGYGGPAYPAQPGQPGAPAYGYAQQLPDHPRATLSLTLGIIGLAGGLICGVGLLVSPFAWFISQRTLREIRESRGQLGGEGNARAGQVMGIIGTVLLVLGVVALAAVVVLTVVGLSSSTSGSTTSF